MNTQTIGKAAAVAIAILAVGAVAEEPKGTASGQRQGAVKTINVVGLEDDKDNAQVAAPADLGAKPLVAPVASASRQAVDIAAKGFDKSPTVATLSADAIAEQAAAAANDTGVKVNTASVKNLTLEGMVIPPSSEYVKTLEEAIRNILAQAGKQVGTVSSNGIDKLTMPYQQLGDGKSYEVEWRKALRILLSPVGYNFTEDGELALFGLAAEVDVKHQQLAQERLTSNRTPILFTTNEAEGGMELRNAIRDVSVKAGVTITTDYMEPADLYVPQQVTAAEGKMTAEDIGKAKQKSVAQQAAVKRTKFDTNGQQIEWRTVLREILNPHGYDFVEVGGVVRIAKRAKLAEWEKEKIAAKPLMAKVIRLYHADPEQVVERVMKIKGILVHPNAILQATRKKDDITSTVKNLNARIQTSSGQQSGMSDTTSQIFDKLIRPRTVPAIVAYDVEENIPNIEAKIKLFDIKEKQILIEAILFQLDMNNGDKGDMDGIKWEIPGDLTGSFSPLYGTFGNVKNVSTTFLDMLGGLDADGNTVVGKGGGTWYEDGKVWMASQGLDFKATIQILRQKTNAKILSNPMLVIGDHSEAAIQVSDVTPIPQIDASTVSSTAGFNDNLNIQWNMLRSGVLMWVCPEITEKGKSVRLTVHPQVITKGDKVDLAELGGVFTREYPVYNYEIKMHEMDTRATVPSGATLMFGGLIDNQETEVEEKVRWLGDLPWIGWLFRSKTKTIVQKNLVVMIRPTILDDLDQTGFEHNALKEIDDFSANTGRDLRKTPYGPHSFQKTGENIKDYLDEKFVKPFRGEDIIKENKQRYLKDEPTTGEATSKSLQEEEKEAEEEPASTGEATSKSLQEAEKKAKEEPASTGEATSKSLQEDEKEAKEEPVSTGEATSKSLQEDDTQSFLTEGHPAPAATTEQ